MIKFEEFQLNETVNITTDKYGDVSYEKKNAKSKVDAFDFSFKVAGFDLYFTDERVDAEIIISNPTGKLIKFIIDGKFHVSPNPADSKKDYFNVTLEGISKTERFNNTYKELYIDDLLPNWGVVNALLELCKKIMKEHPNNIL